MNSLGGHMKTIFNFTNAEVKDLAKDYIEYKLSCGGRFKREFIVLDDEEHPEELKKHPIEGIIEYNVTVQDTSERKYSFRFFINDNFFECFAKSETSIHEIKESSNQDLKVMEIFLINAIKKYGIGYLEDYLDYQMKLEEKSYKEILKETRKEFKKFAEEEHRRRIAAVEEACLRVKDYFLNKNV